MVHRHWKAVVAISLASCALMGCGGGGGGSNGSPSPPPPSQTFTVGGSISGLVGSVTLQNTGGVQLIVSADGSFTFAAPVASGSSYDVTVATQPELQACIVANGSGTASANVTNIAISCADTAQPATLTLSLAAIKTFRFAWTAVPGITRYKLLEDPTGESVASTQVGADIDASATSFDHIVPLHRRVNASYILQACAATRCIDSNVVTASATLEQAVGYFKASSITAFDRFGTSVALSVDGTTLAVGMPFDDSEAVNVDGDPLNNLAPDSGAVLVFVRDGAGLWRRQAYIKPTNTGAQDTFGAELALSADGSTLAVGSPREDSSTTGAGGGNQGNDPQFEDSGAVYVYERSNGSWIQRAYVKASNTGFRDFFGISLALSGDGRTLAVGANREDSRATGVDNADQGDDTQFADSGAVYVFVKEGVLWRQDAYVKASNTGIGDFFGDSVALSADGATLAVGAPNEDSPATGIDGSQGNDSTGLNSGAVYVFTRGESWTQQEYIKASNTGRSDAFGETLALSADGSTLAVGASSEDSAATGIDNDQGDGFNDAGAAYVFVRIGDEWEQQAYVKASNTGDNDLFARSLSLSADGSTLAVGAQNEDGAATGVGGDDRDNSVVNQGAAYVFERSNDTWAQRAYVKPSLSSTGYLFGIAVALSGDGETLAVGATDESGSRIGIGGDQSDSNPSSLASGAVYLY